jgi:hypothetical protein
VLVQGTFVPVLASRLRAAGELADADQS